VIKTSKNKWNFAISQEDGQKDGKPLFSQMKVG
jgi:hypothetical protein